MTRRKATVPARHCGKRTTAGGKCRRGAGWGTQHPGRGACKLHGGRAPTHNTRAAREEAQEQLVAWGLSVEIEPQEALLQCVYRSAGLVSYFNTRVVELKDEAVAAGGDLALWLRLEREETERLARFSKMALDAGVAERRVRIAERTAQIIAQALEETLAPLDLPAKRRAELAAEFGSRLMLLESTAGESDAA